MLKIDSQMSPKKVLIIIIIIYLVFQKSTKVDIELVRCGRWWHHSSKQIFLWQIWHSHGSENTVVYPEDEESMLLSKNGKISHTACVMSCIYFVTTYIHNKL